METIRLGRTGLLVTKTAFGALPIQRISKADAVKLVRRAYESGINYFDTANMYTDSEEKLGAALHDVRQNVPGPDDEENPRRRRRIDPLT